MAFTIAQAWEAAVSVTASTYGVDPALISAPSRGRGPRPPASAWDAKKMAIHLAALVSGDFYAELGRLVGLHRDTVASHCAEMRRQAARTDAGELLSEALERLVRSRLEHLAIAHAAAEQARAAMLTETTRDLITVLRVAPSSDAHPTNGRGFIRQAETDHSDVIDLRKRRARG